MNGARSIRRYFARQPDPYAGGDLDNAQRLTSILFTFLAILTAVALALSPPTDRIGVGGWAVALAILGAEVGLVYALRQRVLASWNSLLLVGYAAVALLGVLQWLGGGSDDPYGHLLLIPVFSVAGLHPPRRILAFLGFVGLAMALPFIYSDRSSDDASTALISFALFCGLSVAINSTMRSIRTQRLDHRESEAAARREARHDPLTGLLNRRAFDEVIGREVSNARRVSSPLSVAMIDVENFKSVNDSWSYTEGDRCLRELAEAMRTALREPDYCFRWGGDEFALVLPGTSTDDTEALAERLQSEVASTCRRPDDEPLQIRVAVAELAEGQTSEDLVRMAGLALTSARIRAAR
jgi:diguanylate cyclase (GGDEF)-like protein